MSAASVMVACNKVEPIPAQEEVGPEAEVEMITETITGSRDVSTKVTIDNTSGAFAWTATNDQIAVHVNNGTYVTSAGASASEKSATFDVTYPAGSTRDAFAVFPSSIIVAADAGNYGQEGHTLDVTLPESYTLAQVTGETSPCPMIATNDPGSSEWSFKQLCGLLRLTVNGIPPSTKRLEIDFDGKKVCGDFSIASPVTPGTSVIETAADDSHDIIKITKDGTDVTLNDDVWLNGLVVNIPLPTGEYTNITVTAYDALSGGNAVQTTIIPCAFAYTANSARAKKLTVSMGYDLSVASFNDNTYPYAHIYQSNPTATSNTITIADGQNILLDGVNMLAQDTNAIVCEGDAEIVLVGTSTVKSHTSNGTLSKAVIKAGTYEPTKTTLTISGDGTLNASPDYPSGAGTKAHDGAVIGADSGGDCGNIVIKSGTITVSTNYGAGIGAGRVGANNSNCGTITIAGGTVNATSSDGAGIGSGTHNSGEAGTSKCDGIIISGGTVTARSSDGAAIGSGKERGGSNLYNSRSYCGYIEITGGLIDARSTHTGDVYAGAAIGSGYNSTAGTIIISGGNITATGGGKAAAIGSGGYGGRCGNIEITGGTIVASGGYQGAGIGTGTGNANNNKSTCGSITIASSVTKVTASNGRSTSTLYKSIGRGYGSTTASCGDIWIGGTKTGEIGTNPYTYQP